jgi:Fe-S oxidoreductase
LQRIDNGEIEIKRKLGWTVTIQESCHAKSLGEEFMQVPRELLARLGCKVVEQRHCKTDMLCCGIGGGFSHDSSYNPLRMTRSTWRGLAGARQTGAQAIVSYCAGCLQMLETGKLTNPLNRMPVYHIIELVKLSIGEETVSRAEKAKRAAIFMAGVTRHQAPALLSAKRFYVEEKTPQDGETKY